MAALMGLGVILLLVMIILSLVVLVDSLRRPDISGTSKAFWAGCAAFCFILFWFVHGMLGLILLIILTIVYFKKPDKDIFY